MRGTPGMKCTPGIRRSVAAAAGLVLVTGLSASIATTSSSTASTPSVTSTARPDAAGVGRCPNHALRLTSKGVVRAGVRALNVAPTLYSGVDTRRAKVQAAARGGYAGTRGRQVRRMCGKTTARRTVVVHLTFPKMRPSASLSQGVVFVSRVPRGYRVWHVAH